MSLPEKAVERPVAVGMATLALVTFGLLAFGRLPVRLLPDLSYPTLTIQTEYEDAAPVEVETFVTRPLEEAVGVTPGVRSLRSASRAGRSEIVLEFGWGTEMDETSLDVREKLGLVRLPRDVDPPRVLRYDPNLDPVLRLALTGDRPLDDMRRLAERWLAPRLEAASGVAAAKVRGGLDPEVEVLVDDRRLASHGLTLNDVASALRAENINRPGGQIRDRGAVYLVRTLNEFETLEQVRRTVLRQTAEGKLRIEDVAEVRRGHADPEEAARMDGREGVEIDLYREGSVNTTAMSDSARRAIAAVQQELPDGLTLEILTDQAGYIGRAVDEVKDAAILGGLLAVLVLLFFLKDLGSTVVIGLAIPVSVAATFIPLHALGVSLNIMSLGGLALGVGMLVDNAIVVLEAIDRKRTEEGLSRAWAAARGAGEVAGAITASTVTTVAVFFPIVFVEGIAGQLFRDLALTVCAALVTSLVVSLTLVPAVAAFGTGMMAHGLTPMTTALDPEAPRRGRRRRVGALFAGLVTRPRDGAGRWERGVHWALAPLKAAILGLVRVVTLAVAAPLGLAWAAAFGAFRLVTLPLTWAFEGLQRAYPGWLRGALKARYAVLFVAAALLAVSLVSIPLLGTELVPDLHQGEFGIRVEFDEGTPLVVSSARTAAAEQALVETGNFARVFSLVGVLPGSGGGLETTGENLARIEIVLPEDTSAARERELAEAARALVAERTGAEVELTRAELLGVGAPIEIELYGEDLGLLAEGAERVRARLQEIPGVTDISSTTRAGQPEVQLALDAERAAYYGLDAATVGGILRIALRGETVGKFREGDDRIDIRVRVEQTSRERAGDVGGLLVGLEGGSSIPVSALGEVVEGRGPAVIYRSSGGRLARLAAKATGRDLGSVLDDVRGAIAELPMPPAVDVRLAGQDEEIAVSFGSLRLMLALALFLVYAAMASLFESLRRPLVILLTVPLGLVGVVGVLWLTGTPVSVLALIGVVMLAGIVVNNAIVLVDAIGRRLREGDVLETAIVAAGQERLRPILMTTATTVLALLPMALSRDAGAELRVPLALTVIGGLTMATVLTLVVIPCAVRVAESPAASARSARRGEPLEGAPAREDA